jgi:hypothetical protein
MRDADDMTELFQRLDDLGLNLMIFKKELTIFTSAKPGIMPLLEAVDVLGLEQLKGSVVVDRIVGKAAALMFCYFKANRVYAKVLSKLGASVLNNYGIGCITEKVVEKILNREGIDICPFEKKVIDIEDPEEGYKVLLEAIKNLSKES